MHIWLISNFVAFPHAPQADVFVRHRASALRGLGADVTVTPIYPVPRLPLPKRLPVPRATDVQWPPKHGPGQDSVAAVLPVPMWSFARALAGHAQSVCAVMAAHLATEAPPADVIVGHGSYRFPAAGVAQELSAAMRVPYVAVAHGSDINSMRSRALSQQQSIFGQAAATVFVSDALLASTRDRGIRPNRPSVIGNGWDPGVFRFVPTRRPGPLHMLFAGSLTEVKGADRLPDLLQAVRHLRPDVTLTIAGDGPLRSGLESTMSGQVTFLGEVPQQQLASAMSAADVLVVPSRDEGFGCVVKESQATGTPVVATAVGGLPESVSTGGEVVSLPQGWDPQPFARAVVQVATRVPRRSAASAAAGFTWEAIARRELEVFRSVQ